MFDNNHRNTDHDSSTIPQRRRRWSFSNSNPPPLPMRPPQMTASRSHQSHLFQPPLASSSKPPISNRGTEPVKEIGSWWTGISNHPTQSTSSMAAAAPTVVTPLPASNVLGAPPVPPPRPPNTSNRNSSIGMTSPSTLETTVPPPLPPHPVKDSQVQPPFDPSRSHLHYRDPEYQQWQSSQAPPQNDEKESDAEKEEAEAIRIALQSSLSTVVREQQEANEEELNLRKALAESAQLAKFGHEVVSVEEQLEISRALLASQRQALMQQRQSGGAGLSRNSAGARSLNSGSMSARRAKLQSLHGGPSQDAATTSSLNTALNDEIMAEDPPQYAGPLSLHESEWLLQARNEKGGSLWREGGAHGWLPPGAARAQDEDEIEREMLALAIKISLEEEAQAKKWRAQLGTDDLASSPESSGTSASTAEVQTPYTTGPAWAEATSRPKERRSSSHSEQPSSIVTRESRSASDPPKPTRPPPPLPKLWTAVSHEGPNANTRLDKGKQVDRPPPIPPLPIFTRRESQQSSSSSTWREYDGSSVTPTTPSSIASVFGIVTSTNRQEPVGSPYEMPYLTPNSPAEPTNQFPDTGMTSPSVAHSNASQRTTTSSNSSRNRSSNSGRSSKSNRSARDEVDPVHTMQHEDPLETLTVRNPDVVDPAASVPDRGLTQSPLSVETLGINETIESQYTGQALSHISERSEPSFGTSRHSTSGAGGLRRSSRSTSPVIPPTASMSPSSPMSENNLSPTRRQETTSPTQLTRTPSDSPRRSSVSPMASPMRAPNSPRDVNPGSPKGLSALAGLSFAGALAMPGVVSGRFEPALSSDQASSIVGEPRFMLEDAVGFGFLAAPRDSSPITEASFVDKPEASVFPDLIELSSAEGADRRTFAIEASCWSTLLRFMMWYGDIVVSATSADQKANRSRRCDCGLALAFRMTETGQPVIRLVITLLPPKDQSNFGDAYDLKITTPDGLSKGKGKASGERMIPMTYHLPDSHVLPTRLSALSVSLYTLRHLALIAASTQPAKGASASYHALRCLANSIETIGKGVASGSDGKGGKRTKKDDEDLLTRMRERLRKLRGGGSVVSTPTPAKLSAYPIGVSVQTTTSTESPHGEDAITPVAERGGFGIGTTSSGGVYGVPLAPRQAIPRSPTGNKDNRKSMPGNKLTRRSHSVDRQQILKELNNGPGNGVSDGPRVGFGMVIRPRRIDPTGEISDLSEDETRWLPTLTRV